MGNRSSTTQTESGVIGCTEARAAQFFDLLDRLQDDDDVELIHDIRVASRRLTEALGVVACEVTVGALPCFRAWLREVRDLLAPVRDADVNRQVLIDLVGGEEALASIPAGVALALPNFSATIPSLSSDRGTTPTLGSMVVNGKLLAAAAAPVRALNRVDFPTLGRPTMPISMKPGARGRGSGAGNQQAEAGDQRSGNGSKKFSCS